MILQTTEYALRAVVHLARFPDESFPAHEIARATQVPSDYMSKILQSLAKAGIVSSRRGLGGGFSLAADPAKLTMLDIVEASDAPFRRITECPLGLESHEKLCALHRRLDLALGQMEQVFRETTIAQFIDESDGIKPLCETAGTTPRVSARKRSAASD